MPASEDQFTEAQHLTTLIFRVAERAKDAFTTIAGECGLSASVGRALLTLEEPAPMHTIAALLACDPSYVTSLADQLESQGLAERAVGDDRRVKLLKLTPAGLEARERLAGAIAAGPSVTSALDARQRRELTALLERMLG